MSNWIGYEYTGSVLQTIDGIVAPSLVTSVINANNISPANGVCVAIRKDGSLVNELCSTGLNGYMCQYTTTCEYDCT